MTITEQIERIIIELYGEARAYVPGDGTLRARVMLIGEAPGRQEVEQGIPFVGQAGKTLDAFLEGARLERNEMYVTNAVKIRPTKPGKKGLVNRPPTRREIEAFKPVLLRELDEVDPGVIVTLGNTPLLALTGEANIGDMHGRPYELHGRTLFAMYHPAALIYNRALAPVYAEDMARLAALVADRPF